jgi:hypothetical protein
MRETAFFGMPLFVVSSMNAKIDLNRERAIPLYLLFIFGNFPDDNLLHLLKHFGTYLVGLVEVFPPDTSAAWSRMCIVPSFMGVFLCIRLTAR